MNRPYGKQTRLGRVLLTVLGVLALLALPGIAAGHNGSHDPPKDAGTIQSFDSDTGLLAIDLTGGGTISGLVTDRTHIKCDHERGRHHGRHHHRHHLRHLARHGVQGGSGQDAPGHDGTPPGASEDPGQGAEHSDRCTTDDLVVGAPVKKAELVLIDGGAFYKMVAVAQAVTPTS